MRTLLPLALGKEEFTRVVCVRTARALCIATNTGSRIVISQLINQPIGLWLSNCNVQECTTTCGWKRTRAACALGCRPDRSPFSAADTLS